MYEIHIYENMCACITLFSSKINRWTCKWFIECLLLNLFINKVVHLIPVLHTVCVGISDQLHIMCNNMPRPALFYGDDKIWGYSMADVFIITA